MISGLVSHLISCGLSFKAKLSNFLYSVRYNWNYVKFISTLGLNIYVTILLIS